MSERAFRRGFTLIELMVAIAAGAIVAMGAFAFAKASTRTFQSELRSANATTAAVLGFRRLTQDIQRAGFLSTPNYQREWAVGNTICEAPSAMTPQAIKTLAGVYIEHGPTPDAIFTSAHSASFLAAANQQPVKMDLPDRITIAGSFDTTEQFPVRYIFPTGGGGFKIVLQSLTGPVPRLAPPGSNPPLGQTIFRKNRIVRIVDRRGYQHFSLIDSAAMGMDPQFPQLTQVSLNVSTPPIAVQGTGVPYGGQLNPACSGVDPQGTGSLLSVVSKVRYQVGDLSTLLGGKPYGALYSPISADPSQPAPAAPPEDASRQDLIRVELDANDTPIPETAELVAEYAVDLRFGGTVDTEGAIATANIGKTPPQPVITTYDAGDPAFYNTWARSVLVNPTQPGPERIRSLRVRFGVRSREADRTSDLQPPFDQGSIVQPSSKLPGGMYRYLIPGQGGAPDRWARVKTMQAEIALLNQQGIFY